MAEILKVTNVSKHFGGLTAVNDVSFSINEGETVGLMGPNGAGKTTLVNMICGSYSADAGKIEFMGKDITKLPPWKRCKLGICRTYQIPRPFPELTALASVVVSALWGKDRPNRSLEDASTEATHYLEFVGLFSKRNVLARDLTLFEMRGLELARALATQPKLIFVDEVMAGLNPPEAEKAVRLIERAKDHFGVTVLWIEHVMAVLMKAAERVIVLHYGEKIAEGRPQEVANNPMVIESYLGKS
ncbi:MAG: ABC transporter ATP-binding protein [Dehalococcoidia bacterium]|nr:ABC transporter ATP-binding protein [Dehalococcoidia bacterium]